MPRVALVSAEEMIALIVKYIDKLKEHPHPAWSSQIWKDMSRDLNERWTFHNVYSNFTQNRRQVRSIAFKLCGIQEPVQINNSLNDSSLIESESLDVDESFEAEDEAYRLEEFNILITSQEWTNMIGCTVTYADGRSYPSLKAGVWTDIIYLAIRRQTGLECNFIFKSYKLYIRKTSLHFLRAVGSCSNKKCDNKLFCYLDREPDKGEDFYMKIRTRNTLDEKHPPIKRQLRGQRREIAGKDAFYEGTGNYQKRLVNESTKFGGRVPPEVPNLDILRKAKKEFSDNAYGITANDSKDVVANIEAMRYDPKYKLFIQDVKSNKFFTSYQTPQQVHAYKQYSKITKKYSSISIDGTGSLVKPLNRPDGSTSGHIFLYVITIHFDGATIPVYSFLTEAQDTHTLTWGIKQWLNSGASKPHQAVCDYSRALMNAITTAFNYQTVKTYNETCFLLATSNPEYNYRPPIYTYLRLDVAHLKNIMRRWECVKRMKFTKVRQLYLFAVSLMIDAETLEDLEYIWSLMCTIGLHEYQDTVLQSGQTVLDARKELEKRIAVRNYDEKETEPVKGDETVYEEDDTEKQSSEHSRVKTWVDDIYNKALKSYQQGCEPNSFYFNDFIERLKPVVYEFCLWTSIPLPFFRGHSTSADVEGHFSDIKNRVLKNYSGPLRVDKFLKIMFSDHRAGATILNSKLNDFVHEEGPCPTPLPKKSSRLTACEQSAPKIENPESSLQQPLSSSESEEQGTEDAEIPTTHPASKVDESSKWHSKLYPTVTGYYFQPQPDISYRNEMSGNVAKSRLLMNGNKVTSRSLIGGKYYSVFNTCGFDSIVQLLMSAALDDEQYLLSLTSSENKTMEFIAKFIQKDVCKQIYDARVNLLVTFFPELVREHLGEVPQLTSYSLDVFENVSTMWRRCFKTEPSAYRTFECPECGEYKIAVDYLDVNHKVVDEEGFQALSHCQDFNKLSNHICVNQFCKQECNVTIDYKAQLFIELDIRPDPTNKSGLKCKLVEFPTTIDLNNQKYRLAGIIEWINGHYKAYCYRGMSNWEIHDDCEGKIIRCLKTRKIEPHGAIYVQLRAGKRKIVEENTTEINEKREHETKKKKVKKMCAQKPILSDLPDEEESSQKMSLEDSDVNSRDNWRCKEKIDVFLDYSMLSNPNSSDNNQTIDDKTLSVIHEGSTQTGITIDTTVVHVANTSAFDSVVHLLWCTAQNNSDYAALIENSDGNTMFNFIRTLRDGSPDDVYRKRAEILVSLTNTSLCSSTKRVLNNIPVLDIEICGTPADIWQNCLFNEPSQYRTYACECGDHVENIYVLEPEVFKICIKSNQLQIPLEFYPKLFKVQCRQPPCSSKCDVEITSNVY